VYSELFADEIDADFGIITPNDLTLLRGQAFHYESKLRGKAGCGLNLKTGAGLGKISYCARNRVRTEEDLSGL